MSRSPKRSRDEVLARADIWASCDPSMIPHAELVDLVDLAGLSSAEIGRQVRALPPGSSVDRATVLKLIDLVRKRKQ